ADPHRASGGRIAGPHSVAVARDGGDRHAARDPGIGGERGQPAGLVGAYPARMARPGAFVDVQPRGRRLPRRRGLAARSRDPRPAGAFGMILRQDEGALTILTLNRPDKANSLTRAMLADLAAHLRDLSGRAQAVILT